MCTASGATVSGDTVRVVSDRSRASIDAATAACPACPAGVCDIVAPAAALALPATHPDRSSRRRRETPRVPMSRPSITMPPLVADGALTSHEHLANAWQSRHRGCGSVDFRRANRARHVVPVDLDTTLLRTTVDDCSASAAHARPRRSAARRPAWPSSHRAVHGAGVDVAIAERLATVLDTVPLPAPDGPSIAMMSRFMRAENCRQFSMRERRGGGNG